MPGVRLWLMPWRGPDFTPLNLCPLLFSLGQKLVPQGAQAVAGGGRKKSGSAAGHAALLRRRLPETRSGAPTPTSLPQDAHGKGSEA